MQKKDLKIAQELKERLSEVVKLLDFKVFGSRAQGDSDEYSDMDVFLKVESLDDELKEKISAVVWEVGSPSRFHSTPLLDTVLGIW